MAETGKVGEGHFEEAAWISNWQMGLENDK
jgi:hypothetical protein